MAAGNSKAIQRKTNVKRLATGKRPAARRVQERPSAFNQFLRENLHWIFLCIAAILCGVVLFYGYKSAAASEFFALKRVDVAGAANVSPQTIERIVRDAAEKNGVWNADLDDARARIEAIAWVKSAVVSRVLPDGLRVRVVEREPKAVVKLASNLNVWVDEDARVLGEAANKDNSDVVLSGWNEDKSPDAAKRNQERIRLFLKLRDEWRKNEIISRVKTINLADLQDIGANVEHGEQQIAVQLGSKDLSERLKTALGALDNIAANGNAGNVERIINYDGHPVVSFRNADLQSKTAGESDSAKTVRR